MARNRTNRDVPRNHSRILSDLQVTLRVPGESAEGNPDRIARFHSLDISLGGIQVGVDNPLRLESLLRLTATIPEVGETFKLAARVAWCHLNEVRDPSWLVGLELIEVKGDDLKRWRTYLKSHAGLS